MKEILLSNKDKEIKEYTLVSDIDYEHLKQFKMYKDKVGYISTYINKLWKLHRYIMIELVGNKDLTRHNFIDHINNNKSDNRRENLRIVTISENNRNRSKAKNATSKYFGVSKHKAQWQVHLTLNKQIFRAYYKIEKHAAYHYDLLISKFKMIHSKKNNIDKPKDFIEYIKKEKMLPKHIYKSNKKYRININGYSKNFTTLQEAIDNLKKYKQNIIKPIQDIIPQIIIRNENNDCIIEIFKNKKRIGETIVDKENYNDLIKYKWSLNTNNYISGSINGKKTLLHRYIMNYIGKDYIDHINNNSLDNRKCNLRIVTPAENVMNKISSKNSTSKYIGVCWHKLKNKWVAGIRLNNKSKYLGTFINEIDAAKARDIATLKYYGEYGNLNFPIS
jgi:hypothetical protein